MLTTRDLRVIDFINEFKVASTSTIAKLFFPSLVVCQRRLKYLFDNKELKRMRESLNNEYIYFKKRPKQLKHSLTVTEFYKYLSSKYDIVNFKIEPVLGDIRPDAVFGYTKNGKGYIGLLEVELSNKGFNYMKYEKFYSSERYKEFFPTMPSVFVVGDKAKIPSNSKINFIKVSV